MSATRNLANVSVWMLVIGLLIGLLFASHAMANVTSVQAINFKPCPAFPNAIGAGIVGAGIESSLVPKANISPIYFLLDADKHCQPDQLMAMISATSGGASKSGGVAKNAALKALELPKLSPWQRFTKKGEPYQWYAGDEHGIALGLTPHDVWFLKAFDIPDPISVTRKVILTISNPLLDNIDIWIYRNTGQLMQTYSLGDQLPFEQRPVMSANFAVPIDLSLNNNESKALWVLLRANNIDSMHFHLRLQSENQYTIFTKKFDLYQGLYIGIMVAMLLYNIVLTLRLPDKEYFIYIVWIPCVVITIVTHNGLGFQYLWPTDSQWNNDSLQLFGSLCAMCAGLFCLATMRAFHHVHYPWPYLLLGSALSAGIGALAILFHLIPYSVGINFSNIIAAITIFLIFVVTGICVSKNVLLSKSYLLAWSTIFCGVSFHICESVGVISHPFSEHSMQVGSTLEALLMSILLSARVHKERQQTILMQKNINQELEIKVSERTQELEALNQQLSVLSVTDGLTGLSNRRQFDERFTQMFHVAQREGGIYLLMVDLDYFKKINDTYGHDFGDTCLKHAAQIIKNHCKRSSDVAARFGGEEFAILLLNIDRGGAEELANNIRLALMNSPLMYGDKKICLTCSIGISKNFVSDADEKQLLVRADEMLYAAKRDGRNCVKTYSEDPSSEDSGHLSVVESKKSFI